MRAHGVVTVFATTAAVVAFLALGPPALATTYLVDLAGGDYLTIQAGLTAAVEGDTVLVAPGTYTGTGNRDLLFETKNIVLRSTGGAPVTTIDMENVSGHRAIMFESGGQDTTCIVDGFTIFDGYVSMVYGNGAGIRCVASSPKIVNCRFESGRGQGVYGGAISLDGASNAVIRDCEFIENMGYLGGAIYCNNNSTPKISNCLFEGNEGGVDGGAIYLGYLCDASIVGCLFVENSTEVYGGAITHDSASGSVSNCTFIRNRCDSGGGALHTTDQSYPVLVNCTFFGSSGAEGGGCIHVDTNSYPTLAQCIFSFTEPSDESTIYVDGTSGVSIMWSCAYANAPGNILPTDPSNYFIGDPLFCDLTVDDLTLANDSPCLSGNNLWDKLIGAHGDGCTQSSVEVRTWGSIKAMYR